jgi:hypothetical protein
MNKILVQSGRAWAVVTVDENANQCTVPNGEGGRFFVRGVGDKAVAQAAAYAVQHTDRTWPTREAAVDALSEDGWRVTASGRLRMDNA